MSIAIFIIWIIAGILNLINIRSTDYTYWRLEFWFTYIVLMTILMSKTFIS